MAEAEEEELSLFLVSSTTVRIFSSPVVSVSTTAIDDSSSMVAAGTSLPDAALEDHRSGAGARAPSIPVELKEERVFAQIREKEEAHDHWQWVLDSGATNNMTGSRSAGQ
jgi:hypothetical protein